MLNSIFAKIFEDPRLDNLHELIKSLYTPDSFKSKFVKNILELNSLLEEKIINQEIYDGCIHTINGLIIIYFNKTINPEPLVYCCSVCGKYFLEKEDKFLKTEIKTTHDINYKADGICSNNCFKELDEILRNLDTGKY